MKTCEIFFLRRNIWDTGELFFCSDVLKRSHLCFSYLWHVFVQCSRSCGGGIQKREIICKQRMADGSLLELPETFCPTPGLPSVRPCGAVDCPAQWISTNWTQVRHVFSLTNRVSLLCISQQSFCDYRSFFTVCSYRNPSLLLFVSVLCHT